MSQERRNSLSSYLTSRKGTIGDKTYIKVLHGDNKTLILNVYCSCLHLLNFVKEKLNLSSEDVIDFIDFDGSLREVPANKEYAIQHLNPTNSYIVLKIETDSLTGEKRYQALASESKLNNSILKSLSNLNSGKALHRGKSKDAKKQTTITSNPAATTKVAGTRKASRNSSRNN